MGRSPPPKSRSSSGLTHASRLALARSRTMIASGFSSRNFRFLSRKTASLLDASTQRWKPPRPFTATTRPAFSSSRVFSTGSVQGISLPCSSRRLKAGPQTGQAFGSAWNLRSRGSSYSRLHLSHKGKACMEVLVRS